MDNVRAKALKLIRRLNLLKDDEPDKAVTERHLNALLKKYGLSLEDFESEADEMQNYAFPVTNDDEYELLIGTCRSVLQRQVRMSARNSPLMAAHHQCAVELKPSEYPTVEMAFQVYKQQFSDVVRSALVAFMSKNDLIVTLPDDPVAENNCTVDLQQARDFMSSMRKTQVFKGIAHG